MPPGWTFTDSLLADLWSSLTGERHPLTEPIVKRVGAEKHHAQVLALQDHARRMAERQARLNAAAPAPSDNT